MHQLPFAVLEVKLHNHLLYHPPAWVDDLMNSDLLIRVDKFSKYGHGTAVLYNDLVEVLPYWLDGEFFVGGLHFVPENLQIGQNHWTCFSRTRGRKRRSCIP